MSVRSAAVKVATVALVALTGGVAVATPSVQGVGNQLPEGWEDSSSRQPALAEIAEAGRAAAGADRFRIGYTFELRAGVSIGCDFEGRRSSIGLGDDDRLIIAIDDEAVAVESGEDCNGPFGLFLDVDLNSAQPVVGVRLASWRTARRLELPVVWLGTYATGESLDFLRDGIFDSEPSRPGLLAASLRAGLGLKERKRLLLAAAVHADPQAMAIVTESLSASHPGELREQGVFLTAAFDVDSGVERLLEIAKNDADAAVQKSAIFWLGQKAGAAVTAALEDVAVTDPDTDVRKAAVFALSQSDTPDAFDSLVRIVRTNQNPEVVKAALFWLGQSGDPRVVAVFEEILFGRR